MKYLYIAGKWTEAADDGTSQTINPYDATVLDTLAEASAADVDAAVAAAREAFDGPWRRSTVTDRAALLGKIADLLQRDREQLAHTESLDTGKTLNEARADVDDTTAVFRYYAGMAGEHAGRVVDPGRPGVVSRIVHEPVGVCALIAPWNYPLLQMSWKIAPALAAGCTMVAKPSEVTPLSTIAFVHLVQQALKEIEAPDGVVNLVQGSGAVLGAALTDTPDVDFISFTGGLATGRTIAKVAAEHVTKAAVELGGKNPHIVFADIGTGDGWDSAVDQVLTGVFLHSGQVCSAGPRLIVEESIADDFVAALVVRAERIRIGDGMDPTSETGPLVSEQHRAKVEAHVAVGISEGAKLMTGGARPTDPALAAGSFYPPTIFDHCDRSMKIVQEETFGPILTVERFTEEAEAIRLGNDTEYGLAGGVRTSDLARGERVVRALRHGTVWLNDFGYYTAAAEWGGFKKSGNGRELGPTGLAEYQEIKHIWHNTAPKPAGWFKGQ